MMDVLYVFHVISYISFLCLNFRQQKLSFIHKLIEKDIWLNLQILTKTVEEHCE